ncbi:toxin-antitoxin system HicB family antitoxin [Nocardiopsis valliformis]|uniref:toxin-antitoxin system HicB family antitoxin n=1 Tax=Nocardiopsis valliformis TaxID=239974 RepID=UPI0009FFD63A
MKHVNLRLPDDLHAQAVEAARADDRSLNSWLVVLVRRAVEGGETVDRPGGGPPVSDPLRGSGHSPRP